VTTTLGEAYPLEQTRLRRLIEQYRDVGKLPGVNCTFAIIAIEDVQRRADEAAISGDVVAMVRLFQEMKGCE